LLSHGGAPKHIIFSLFYLFQELQAVAHKCLTLQYENRPSASQVVAMLRGEVDWSQALPWLSWLMSALAVFMIPCLLLCGYHRQNPEDVRRREDLATRALMEKSEKLRAREDFHEILKAHRLRAFEQQQQNNETAEAVRLLRNHYSNRDQQ
jgi:hypothetical protein